MLIIHARFRSAGAFQILPASSNVTRCANLGFEGVPAGNGRGMGRGLAGRGGPTLGSQPSDARDGKELRLGLTDLKLPARRPCAGLSNPSRGLTKLCLQHALSTHQDQDSE